MGRPVSLLQKIGLEDLLDKWPRECVSMGERVGSLSASAADHLGLPQGIPVIQGGPDAYVGMIGLGCIEPGQMALITGSSHLQLCVTNSASGAPGTWGAFQVTFLNVLFSNVEIILLQF
jgi:ribulose kinase